MDTNCICATITFESLITTVRIHNEKRVATLSSNNNVDFYNFLAILNTQMQGNESNMNYEIGIKAVNYLQYQSIFFGHNMLLAYVLGSDNRKIEQKQFIYSFIGDIELFPHKPLIYKGRAGSSCRICSYELVTLLFKKIYNYIMSIDEFKGKQINFNFVYPRCLQNMAGQLKQDLNNAGFRDIKPMTISYAVLNQYKKELLRIEKRNLIIFYFGEIECNLDAYRLMDNTSERIFDCKIDWSNGGCFSIVLKILKYIKREYIKTNPDYTHLKTINKKIEFLQNSVVYIRIFLLKYTKGEQDAVTYLKKIDNRIEIDNQIITTIETGFEQLINYLFEQFEQDNYMNPETIILCGELSKYPIIENILKSQWNDITILKSDNW